MSDKKSSKRKKDKNETRSSMRKKIVKADKGGVAIGRDVSGSTIVTGNQNIVDSRISQQEKFIDNIFIAIDKHPDIETADKEDLKSEIKELQKEDTKGEEVDESFVARRLRNIRRIAPDILDVILATITNPAAGFSMITKKVADKMKADTMES
jgi:hypothetical protein